ncbi:MAG: hypothetical protein QXM91_03490, partial [Nitrososphaerota archaeon]
MQLTLFQALGVEGNQRQASSGRSEGSAESEVYYLLSAGYDGKSGKAYLKLFNTRTRKVELLYDETGHLPYCFTDLDEETV